MKRSSTLLCLFVLAACDGGPAGPAARTQAVSAVCVADDAPLPAGAWLCPAPLVLPCDQPLPPLYVRDAGNASCALQQLASSSVDPSLAGPQRVTLSGPTGAVVCETTVSFVQPTATPGVINLWPPNHKLHTITVEDCLGVSASCGGAATAEFIWASSDEPIDDIGDGHHAPDILFDGCDRVQVRSERQGPKDGRVYKLGVRRVDALGVASDSECAVIVDHDQRGVVGADSGEKYRITLDGKLGQPLCDGLPPVAPPPPVMPPVTTADAGILAI